MRRGSRDSACPQGPKRCIHLRVRRLSLISTPHTETFAGRAYQLGAGGSCEQRMRPLNGSHRLKTQRDTSQGQACRWGGMSAQLASAWCRWPLGQCRSELRLGPWLRLSYRWMRVARGSRCGGKRVLSVERRVAGMEGTAGSYFAV